MEDKKGKFLSFLKKIKTEYLIMAALILVALIVFFGINTGENEKSETAVDTVSSYVTSLENKLKSCLTKVKGAGKVDVIISVSSSMESVVASKTVESGGKITEEPITVSGKPFVIKEAYPEITGVIVVAEGAANISVKVDLMNACTTFLSISEDKVRILSMK